MEIANFFTWTNTPMKNVLSKLITLRMVFIKCNSLKSDIFFNLIFIPFFSGFMFFRVQVFQSLQLWTKHLRQTLVLM